LRKEWCFVQASTHKARIYKVPPGSPEARALLPSLGPDTMFFRSDSDWAAANGGGVTAVFDLVRDFGADRAGRTDAAPALAACVKAAATKSNGAECYVPAGNYILNATVELCGGENGWSFAMPFAIPLGSLNRIFAKTGSGQR
jgi:hypothetical protein